MHLVETPFRVLGPLAKQSFENMRSQTEFGNEADCIANLHFAIGLLFCNGSSIGLAPDAPGGYKPPP
jgi:hypothetical protein